MTRKEAGRILGITPDAKMEEIKKRYRQIMTGKKETGRVAAKI